MILTNVPGHVAGQSPLPSPASIAATDITSSVSPASEFLKLRPQHISAVELSLALQLVIGDRGTQAVLPGQDMVLVAGPPEILQRAVHMLEQVDQPRLQIRLTMVVFEVELEALKQLKAAAATQLKSQLDANALAVEFPNGSRSVDQSQFHVLANQLGHDEALKLLVECAGARLLADPVLTVVDRQTACFNIGTRIPLGSQVLSDRGEQSRPINSEEAGVKLTVTPRLANDSTVELHVAPEYSSLVGFNSQGTPVVEVRRAETTVRVANRQLLVIGGLRKRTNEESSQTAPGMLGFKAVSPVFRNASASELRESELICLVRPEIVGLPATVTQPLAQNLRSERMSQPQPMQLTAVNYDDASEWNHQMSLPTDPAASVQSGAYQESSLNRPAEQVTPSAYQPSVYAKPRTHNSRGRNINTSRNSVTQPLPFSIRNPDRP